MFKITEIKNDESGAIIRVGSFFTNAWTSEVGIVTDIKLLDDIPWPYGFWETDKDVSGGSKKISLEDFIQWNVDPERLIYLTTIGGFIGTEHNVYDEDSGKVTWTFPNNLHDEEILRILMNRGIDVEGRQSEGPGDMFYTPVRFRESAGRYKYATYHYGRDV